MDQRLNQRPVRKYGSSGHRPAIGAVTPFVVLSKSRNINEQNYSNYGEHQFL